MRSGSQAMESYKIHAVAVKGLVALLLALLAVGTGLYLVESDRITALISRIEWLHVKRVEVNGEWPTTPETVRTWLPPLEGKSILLLRAQKLISHIEGKPWVKAVTITKEYPDGIRVDVIPKRAAAISLEKSRPFFIDTEGEVIERVSAPMLKRLNLPVISREEHASGWEMRAVLKVLDTFRDRMHAKYKISQIVLGTFPYFRIFLSTPQIEVAFSIETWEEQLPHLALLLDSPPSQIGQIHRVNLYYPKKAVVRSSLSN